MAAAPFISVIVPTHNRRQALAEMLACLECQDYPAERFEIILVDDGSTDGTQAMLKQWAKTTSLRLVTQAQRGPGMARNAGAQIARGEVLAFTDSDCLPEPGWLSALTEVYTRLGSDPPAAVGGRVENFARGSWLRTFQARRGIDHTANHSPSPLYLDTANASFRKDIFLAVRGFNPAYAWSEDVDLGLRLRCAGVAWVTTPDAVVWHAGTTSFARYLERSRRIGYAKGLLAADYPEVFYPPPPRGWRLALRSWLDQRAQRGSHARSPLLAGLLHNLVQFLTWEKIFWGRTLPDQLGRYRAQRLNGLVTVFYLCLEWICHLAHLAGLGAYYLGKSNQPGWGKPS